MTNPANFSKLLDRPVGSRSNLAQDVGYLWRLVPAPVIASIHGICFGGGLQIALGVSPVFLEPSCPFSVRKSLTPSLPAKADMRICHPSAKLSVMEAKWGLIPDMSASVTLRELVPIDVAKMLTMTARVISGAEARYCLSLHDFAHVACVCDLSLTFALSAEDTILSPR
jgi:enoyl-CoA hydratase/carnithine racemase